MYILHLSDLHFGTKQDAELWSGQLADDLRQLLSQLEHYQDPAIGTVLISGDISNESRPDEYDAAERFINRLLSTFTLKPYQVVIVPGNHDFNLDLSQQAYEIQKKENYPGPLDEENVLKKSLIVDGDYIHIPDDQQYKLRFQHFSDFYKVIMAKPYPLEYDRQYDLRYFPDHDLLVLGLNSAWQLNHDPEYRLRASINPYALNNALEEINQNQTYKESKLKIAMWHHPLDSPDEDRIKDRSFMARLSQNNFRIVLHGHIHRAHAEDYRYSLVREVEIIASGTFGAPVRQWVPGYPLQYNLLKWQGNRLTVYNRKRIEPNGAWQPDAMWFHGDGVTASSYYEVELDPSRTPIQPFRDPASPNSYHFEQVAAAIKAGEIVPFLGPGINLYDRHSDPSTWQLDDPYPPTRSELALYLEKRIFGEDYALTGAQCALCDPTLKTLPSNCPIRLNALFSRLDSKHVSELSRLGHGGTGVLQNAINSIFKHPYPPNDLHRFLATLWSRYHSPKLIVTANFDRTLESAFQAQKQAFDLITYAGSTRGFIYQKFRNGPEGLVNQSTQDESYTGKLDDADLDPTACPAILKLYGPVDWKETTEENFAITEDHFIEYLSSTSIGTRIPASLLDELKNSSIWFLGYGLNHWDERVILHRIWPNHEYRDKRNRSPWWAVQSYPQELDRYLWDQSQVELFVMPLADYIARLQAYI
jgi:UDP-2,3-diacylglucosamine pyrophosphatase LpxH